MEFSGSAPLAVEPSLGAAVELDYGREEPLDTACRSGLMQPVDSTAIAAVGYEDADRVLEVRFAAGGTYRYLDVEPEIAAAFIAAASKGRFFHAHILDRYAFERLR